MSPVLHRAAYRHLGLDWTYDAVEITKGGLGEYVSSRDAALRGLSVTMPLKHEALELADVADDVATAVDAANTLVFEPDGTIAAANTDVPGMIETINLRSPRASSAGCLWGGGATAASALLAVSMLGVRQIHVHARDAARAQGALKSVLAARELDVEFRPWQVGPQCAEAELVVSTAPAGATDSVTPELARSATPSRLLFDVVYDPWPTALAGAWKAAGGLVASGLDLLVHQAKGQIELMTGRTISVDVLFAAAR
jgi:shikimate dehydrogenase